MLDLIEVNTEMALQYRLTLRWRDSRLKFRHLKENTYLNTIGREDALKVWHPKVVFYNTKEKEKTKVMAILCNMHINISL